MKRATMAILCMAALVLFMAGCSEKEDTTTTVTGIVVSVDGTVVTLRQFDANAQGGGNRGNSQGQRPSDSEGSKRPEGDFTMPEGDFTPPEGDFTMPEGGFSRPEGDFTRPQGDFDPNNADGELPDGMTAPSMPADGERPGSGSFGDRGQGEPTTVDLKNAHISIQDGDIKAAGSISDIKAGSFLTVTLNSKGEATEVLVSTMNSFGGGRGQGGFSGTGSGKGNRGNKDKQANGSIEQAA